MSVSRPKFPKDKYDIERAQDLLKCDSELLIDWIPDLLYYLTDMNWPVAETMAKVLSQQKSQNLIPHFLRSLRLTELIDSDLKRGILYFVDEFWGAEEIVLMKSELLWLIHHPSKFDLDEGVTEMAQSIVEKYALS